MLRRLIRSPAQRPCYRKFSSVQSVSTHVTSTSLEPTRCQHDGNPSSLSSAQYAAPNNSHPLSRGFENQDMPSRNFSSEAIHALSPSATHHDASGVMLNPLLNITKAKQNGAGDDSIAFFELFKAISTLNRQPTPTSEFANVDASILGVENNDDMMVADSVPGSACDQEDEGKLNAIGHGNLENQNEAAVADQKVSEDQDNIAAGTTETSNANQNVLIQSNDPSEIDRQRKRLRNFLIRELKHIHNDKGSIRVMRAFREARASPHELLSDEQICDIFYKVVHYDMPGAYEVLKYYAERCKAEGRIPKIDMYQRVIHKIRPPHMQHDRGQQKFVPWRMDAMELIDLVEDLKQHICENYSEGKKMVYQYILLPEIVVALLDHNFGKVKALATPLIEHILDNKFPMLDPDLYQYMLSKSRHHTENNTFPYHRVLSELISSGYPPNPEVVLQLLQCYYPFNDIGATHEILSIIQRLHQGDIDSTVDKDFRVDLGTLEAISRASARLSVELGLLVWDLVEMFGDQPTESMFEDIIMSFAATKQDQNMFSALADMDKYGFVPSQALLRYVAVKVSYNEKRLDHCQRTLTWRDNDYVRSTHGMNVLLIGYGLRQDINNSFFVFEDLPNWELQPDANTFTFLMESVYIDTKNRFPYKQGHPSLEYNPEDIDEVMGVANIIVDSMEEAGIKKTKKFFHEHIRLLCTIGKLEDARSVLDEAISLQVPVSMNTLFTLATRYADNKDFENAYAIGDLSEAAGCGILPRLASTINNIRRRQGT